MGIINPIPKSSTMDPRDPLSYRGITLASAMYKIYCAVLNKRLSKWVENNGILVDEQNGFRKGQSTVDHISSLSNLINSRKKAKLDLMFMKHYTPSRCLCIKGAKLGFGVGSAKTSYLQDCSVKLFKEHFKVQIFKGR